MTNVLHVYLSGMEPPAEPAVHNYREDTPIESDMPPIKTVEPLEPAGCKLWGPNNQK